MKYVYTFNENRIIRERSDIDNKSREILDNQREVNNITEEVASNCAETRTTPGRSETGSRREAGR